MPDMDTRLSSFRLILELPRQIERMHRRFLDVIRLEMWREGIRDISPVQIMMLSNIGNEDSSVRDLIERGYYLGSNASYNLKHLVDGGYVERTVSSRDRRAAHLKITPKGQDVLTKLAAFEERLATPVLAIDSEESLETTHAILQRLERCWSDAMRAMPSAGQPTNDEN